MTVGVAQAIETLIENMVGGMVSSRLCWAGMFIFSCPLTSVLLGLQPSDSDQDLNHPPPDSQAYGLRLGHVLLVPFVLRSSDLSRMTLCFLVLQILDGRLWDFSASVTMLTSYYTQSPPVCVYISNWSCFCRNPNAVSLTFSDLPGLIWLQGQADTEQILLLSQHLGEETDQRSWAAVWGNPGPLTSVVKNPSAGLGRAPFPIPVTHPGCNKLPSDFLWRTWAGGGSFQGLCTPGAPASACGVLGRKASDSGRFGFKESTALITMNSRPYVSSRNFLSLVIVAFS